MKTLWGSRVSVVSILLILFFVLFLSLKVSGYSVGLNYRNVSVDTRVNITNAAPEVLSVILQDPVTLNAGTSLALEANVSIRDYNGFSDIDVVNMTFFAYSSSSGAADDNNTHYTNSSCYQTAANGFYANYSCTVFVWYYAVNGTWTSDVWVNDTKSFTGNNSNATSVNALFALNVTPLIDYGDMAIYDTSANKTANITNFGNVPINITVYGYGASPGDGLAMVCDVGSISIANERFSANVSANYSDKIPLSSSAQPIPGLVVPKQQTTSQVTNITYWQLYVPPNPFGLCNGTVVFQAEEYLG